MKLEDWWVLCQLGGDVKSAQKCSWKISREEE